MSQTLSVPEGYKLTEMGVIPGDWEVSKVCEQFDIQLGKMLDTEKNVGIYKPYIGNRSVQWDRINASELPTMAMSTADLQRFRLNRGDLLVCEGGEVGRAAIWNQQLAECYYQKALHRLRPTHGFDSRLMLALLRYWADHGHLTNFVSQTSIAHLTREKFAEVPMPVPPRAEQRAIATALSDVDALLAKLDQLIAKKRDLKQAAMQQLLTGQTRLPGFSGEWVERLLGDIAPLQRGFDLPNSQLKRGPYPVVYSKGIGNQHAAFQVKGPGVVTGRSGTIGAVTYVEKDFWPHNTSLWVKAFKDNDAKFVFYLYTRIGLERFATGSGVPTLNRNDVHMFKIRIPASKVEQTAIATLLSDMDAELAGLETRQGKTRDLKQGMMQALLTGRIRLV